MDKLSSIVINNLILLFLFGFSNTLKAQVQIKEDTTVVSHSAFSDSEGVIYSIKFTPKSAKMGDLKILDHSVELILIDGEYKIPHECLALKIDDQIFQAIFPNITYLFNRESLIKYDQISILSNCNLITPDNPKVTFYFDDIKIGTVNLNDKQIKVDHVFSRLLKSSNKLKFSTYIENNYPIDICTLHIGYP